MSSKVTEHKKLTTLLQRAPCYLESLEEEIEPAPVFKRKEWVQLVKDLKKECK